MADWATPVNAIRAANSTAKPNTPVFFFMFGPPLKFLNAFVISNRPKFRVASPLLPHLFKTSP
jgi:hypothetical protein